MRQRSRTRPHCSNRHIASRATLGCLTALACVVGACGEDAASEDEARARAERKAEFVRALPDRTSLSLELRAPPQGRGLTAADYGRRGSALVGEPSEFYAYGYHAARDLDGIADFVVALIEGVTKLEPTFTTTASAIWGPFSDRLDPNEYALGVARRGEAPSHHYAWALAGKPKGRSDDAYEILVAGAFEPGPGADDGRGWFALDFEKVRQLDPTEEARGVLAYAILKEDQSTVVRVLHRVEEAGSPPREAGYAYGRDRNGIAFVLFALRADIDDGAAGKEAEEDVLLLDRVGADGSGRADLVVTNGDVGADTIQIVQCWDATFTARFERLDKNGAEVFSAGEVDRCALGAPTDGALDLPDAREVATPHDAHDMSLLRGE